MSYLYETGSAYFSRAPAWFTPCLFGVFAANLKKIILLCLSSSCYLCAQRCQYLCIAYSCFGLPFPFNLCFVLLSFVSAFFHVLFCILFYFSFFKDIYFVIFIKKILPLNESKSFNNDQVLYILWCICQYSAIIASTFYITSICQNKCQNQHIFHCRTCFWFGFSACMPLVLLRYSKHPH